LNGSAQVTRARPRGKHVEVPHGIRRHGYPVAALTLLVVIAYGGAVAIHPLYLDNVIYFSLGARSDPSTFFTDSFTTYFPAYRPLGTLSFWLQYQWAELAAGHYFVFNIFVWLACCVAVYALVARLSGSRLAGTVAGAFLMVDDRVNWVIWNLTERQNALSCLFGLLALLVMFAPFRERHTRVAAGSIFAFLLLAALSKEYGLVFSAAIVVGALSMRGPGWKLVAGAAVAAVGAYAVLRLGLAGGASTPFCDGMGFFADRREVCYDDLGTGAKLQQYAYNVGATFVGTFVPSAFDKIGAISFPGQYGTRGLILPILVAIGAVAAALRWPRQVAPLLTLVVVNTALSFVQYRTRNQMVAVIGLYVAGGMGLALAIAYVRERANARRLAAAGAAVLLALLALQTRSAADGIDHIEGQHARLDPCQSLRKYPRDVNRNVVREMKEKYGLSNPRCE